MVDLSNGDNWLKIYDQFHVAQPNPNKIGRHYPIPYILIPTYLDNYTVAVFINTTQSKLTWKLGGRIYPVIEVNNSDIGKTRYNKFYTVPINESTVFKLNQISTYYRILVDVPKWFVDAYVRAWVFTGIEPVNTVEQRLDDIKTQLIRIEEEITTNTGQ